MIYLKAFVLVWSVYSIVEGIFFIRDYYHEYLKDDSKFIYKLGFVLMAMILSFIAMFPITWVIIKVYRRLKKDTVKL